MRAGGLLVKDYGAHFLREDRKIRTSSRVFEENEAYSLFCVEPYGRIAVYAGPREWVIKKADEKLSIVS